MTGGLAAAPGPNSRRTLRIASLVFLAAGSIGWAIIYFIFRTTPGQDWMVFDTAAQAWRRGDIALLLDGPRFTAVLNATHSWLREPLVFHPWVYPPYTMLLALPFGLLPWWLNYTAFLCLSLAGLIAALRLWRPAGLSRTMLIAGVLACPATAFTLGAGQNSFMSAGLVTAGIWFMHRRPHVAGLCLGLLAFKPQLAILVPVALAASGAWLAIAYAAGTVLILLAASLVVPGPALWAGWLHLFLGGDPAFHQWVNAGRIYGQSVFTCLRIAGVPETLANTGQAIAILFAGACVWRAYRAAPARAADLPRATAAAGRVPPPAGWTLAEHHRFAVLLAGMILAAAHLGDYDCMLLGIAAMLVLTDGLTLVFKRGVALLAALVWISTGFQPPFVFHAAVVTPLIVAAFMLRVLTLPVVHRAS